jgi:hypothetical protein
MGDPHERQQVVFAHRPHRDRARQYQLVVVLVVPNVVGSNGASVKRS